MQYMLVKTKITNTREAEKNKLKSNSIATLQYIKYVGMHLIEDGTNIFQILETKP